MKDESSRASLDSAKGHHVKDVGRRRVYASPALTTFGSVERFTLVNGSINPQDGFGTLGGHTH